MRRPSSSTGTVMRALRSFLRTLSIGGSSGRRAFRPGRIVVSPNQTPAAAAAGLRARSVAQVRQVLDADAERALSEFAARTLVASGSPGENLVRLDSDPPRQTPEGLVYDSDLTVIRQILTPRLIAIARAYFSETTGTSEFILPYTGLNCRQFDPRHSDDDMVIPFHQDAFAYPGVPLINCWVLLHPEACGERAPGLDFLPIAFDRLQPMESRPASKQYAFLETDHALLDTLQKRHRPFTPLIRRGDVMMFTAEAMHRTSRRPGAVDARVSAEVRLMGATPEALAYMATRRELHATVRDSSICWPSRWRSNADGSAESLEVREATL
jgi:hypothetical protein